MCVVCVCVCVFGSFSHCVLSRRAYLSASGNLRSGACASVTVRPRAAAGRGGGVTDGRGALGRGDTDPLGTFGASVRVSSAQTHSYTDRHAYMHTQTNTQHATHNTHTRHNNQTTHAQRTTQHTNVRITIKHEPQHNTTHNALSHAHNTRHTTVEHTTQIQHTHHHAREAGGVRGGSAFLGAPESSGVVRGDCSGEEGGEVASSAGGFLGAIKTGGGAGGEH